MKLVLYRTTETDALTPGLLTDRGVVDIADAVSDVFRHTPQDTMEGIIDNFETLRPSLGELAAGGDAMALDSVWLGPPLAAAA